MALLSPTTCRRSAWRIAVLLLSVWLLGMDKSIAGQPATSKEYQIKAAFLYHFPEFVEWPSSAFSDPSSALVIGVLGDDPFGTFLDDTVRGERINGHALVIRRYKRVGDVTGCQVLFVSRSENSRLNQILSELKGRSILTVGDLDDFSNRGGMIRFVIEDDKTRLSINLGAAKAAHLTISSKLLRRAQIVNSQGG